MADESVLPTVTGMEAIFNPTTGKMELKISGSGFEGRLRNGDLTSLVPTVAGEEQTVLAVSDDEVIIQIDNLPANAGGSPEVALFFPVGLPNGSEILAAGVEIPPVLRGLSGNEGSAAGSVIEASVPGAYPGQELMLVNKATGEEICETAVVETYGVVKCTTKPVAIDSAAEIALYIPSTGQTSDCVNDDPALCRYQT